MSLASSKAPWLRVRLPGPAFAEPLLMLEGEGSMVTTIFKMVLVAESDGALDNLPTYSYIETVSNAALARVRSRAVWRSESE
jgi:hypothetical protein